MLFVFQLWSEKTIRARVEKRYEPPHDADFHSWLDGHVEIFQCWCHVDVVVERHVLEFDQS